MQSFAYAAPETVQQALDVLAEHQGAGRRAQVMAGGTDLMVQMRLIDRSPRTIVDIKKLAETNRLDIGAKEIYIGAAIPGAVLTASKPLVACLPGLVEAVDLIGSSQIQGRASLGGNLCNASPAGDTISALVANAGVCVIASKGGQREMPVESFVVGVGKNALKPGEFLLGIKFQRPAKGTVGRVPALHSAHGNGYRSRGRRCQRHARCERCVHRRARRDRRRRADRHRSCRQPPMR